MRHKSHAACAWQARWLQDVANFGKKLKSLSFRNVSEGTSGTFSGSVATFWEWNKVVKNKKETENKNNSDKNKNKNQKKKKNESNF